MYGIAYYINLHYAAVAPMDYEAVSTTFMFAACETRRCVNVVIVEDITVESIETFGITLERTPDLDSRITLTPVAEQIEIIDNDCNEHSTHFITVSYVICYYL